MTTDDITALTHDDLLSTQNNSKLVGIWHDIQAWAG